MTRLDTPKKIGEFIKARDPAYAARRRTGQPISDEPNIDDLNVDPLTPVV